MTSEERQTPDNTVKYKRRLPKKRTNVMNVMVAKTFKKLRIDVAWSGANGLLYALNICTRYGVIAKIPEHCRITNRAITMAKDLSVRLRLNSDSRCISEAGGWTHFKLLAMQASHDLERSEKRLRSLNSLATTAFGTQPRNQHNDCSARSVKPFDNNQCGVSGIWWTEKVFYFPFFISIFFLRNELKTHKVKHHKRYDWHTHANQSR